MQIVLQELQRNYDDALPVIDDSFDELQSYYIDKLKKMGIEKAILNAFPFMDRHNVSKALKACSVDFNVLFNAISYELAKQEIIK